MKGRRLKVFQAHLGFYDMIVAAPSQKAALAAWGAGAGEFARGFAGAATEPRAVETAMAHPGKVLARPFGSNGEYKLQSDPVSTQKLSPRQNKAAADMAREEKRRATLAREEAERELKSAHREEARQLRELQKREAELDKEKAVVRAKARKRVEHAKARLAGSGTR